MRSRRRDRAESEIHTIVLSVLVSIYLWALFSVWHPHFFSRTGWPTQLSLAAHLLAAYALGWLWACMPALSAYYPFKWLPEVVGTQDSQLIVRFLTQNRGQWVRFQFADDTWMQGLIRSFDGDPERFADLHILLTIPMSPKTTPEGIRWEYLPNVQVCMICMSNVKLMQSMGAPKQNLAKDDAPRNRRSKSFSFRVPFFRKLLVQIRFRHLQ
jgi:hypothetical protein